MIDCDSCGKRHRDKAAVLKCRVSSEKRAAKAAKLAADAEARQAYAALHPLRDYLAEQRAGGRQWVNINADVKRLYPPPSDWAHECGQTPCPVETFASKEWTIVVILGLDSERFKWPMSVGSSRRYAQEVRDYANTPWVETVPWKKTPIARGDGAAYIPLDVLHEWYLEHTEEVEDESIG